METETVFYVIIAFVVLGIASVVVIRSFGTGVVEASQTRFTPNLSVNMVNYAVNIERPAIHVRGHYYAMHVTPRLRVSGEEKANMIAIMSFKGVDAVGSFTFGGEERQTFPVEEGVAEPIIFASMVSSVPPITEASGDAFADSASVIIKGGGQILMTPYADWERDLGSLLSYCRVKFKFECEKEIAFSRFLKVCGDKPSECEDIVNACGGSAEIKLIGADCDNKKVTAIIDYSGGVEFEPQEIVGVSFWRDTACTQLNKASGFRALLVFCPADRFGGVFNLEAGRIDNK